MKKLFYIGILVLAVFEAANVYFIMPMPGSQRLRTLDLAYALYSWRWAFRLAAVAMIVAGLVPVWRAAGWRRWLAPGLILFLATTAFATNFKMAADRIFLAPQSVTMRPAAQNVVDTARLVVGIVINDDARAYPIQFIGYHHQVRDTIGGRPVMVTFCTVCRTGRVFDPVVEGKEERFRLVGMDHFNAMFEDHTTKSWWMQSTGHAVAGRRRGLSLAELPSQQVTLARWLTMYPKSLIMQPDSALRDKYSASFDYETGKSRRSLTGTDTASWREKSWVIGVALNDESKAYDWNQLRRERVINDVIGGRPIVVVLGADGASFFAYARPDSATFALRGDSLVAGTRAYAVGLNALQPIQASQEFWHSWRTFHPRTTKYQR
jgi:hypothetical protein